MNFFEKAFWDSLESLFIGSKIEGQSGYVNLMNIKNKYYQYYMKPKLLNYIESQKISEEFKEELYSKLYSFFDRYFSESGSIYYKYTPLYYKIYEEVYNDKSNKYLIKTFDNDYEQILSDKEDVSLFWKTRMLYYIKTDRIINSIEIEINDKKIYFDASDIELKQNNEKKKFIYQFDSINQNRLILKVKYSERGTKTKVDEIIKKSKKYIEFTEEELQKAFQIFEKQSYIDYFINKNAEEFLKKQFDLWMYQYLYSQDTSFSFERYQELNKLKKIAYKVIEFIANFENELKKVWEKPRLILENNYIISLALIREDEKLFEKILKSNNLNFQKDEWRKLNLIENEAIDLKDEKWNTLPLDTRHFPELYKDFKKFLSEKPIDGILIKSENFQALNTLKEKYKNSIKAIYIDPPYNTENDEFIYEDKFKSSTYLTMLENRISLAKDFLTEDGVFFCSIANNANKYKESYKVGLLLDKIFEKRFADLIWKRRGGSGSYTISDITENHEYIYVFGKEKSKIFSNILNEKELKKYEQDEEGNYYKWTDLVINQYTKEERPNMFFEVVYNFKEDKIYFDKSSDNYNPLEEYVIIPPSNSVFAMNKESLQEVYKRGVVKVFKKGNKYEIKLKKYLYDENGIVKGKPLNSLLEDEKLPWKVGQTSTATTELKNIFGKKIDFKTAKPTGLLKLLFYISTKPGEMILDFFGGSGSTIQAIMELNKDSKDKRKFIVIEMGEHFYDLIIPRTKKLMFSLQWKNGKPLDKNNDYYIIQYHELEQYEMILKNIEYCDTDCTEFFEKTKEKNPFIFDKKLIEFINENKEIKENLINEKYGKKVDIEESLKLGYHIKDFFVI